MYDTNHTTVTEFSITSVDVRRNFQNTLPESQNIPEFAAGKWNSTEVPENIEYFDDFNKIWQHTLELASPDLKSVPSFIMTCTRREDHVDRSLEVAVRTPERGLRALAREAHRNDVADLRQDHIRGQKLREIPPKFWRFVLSCIEAIV